MPADFISNLYVFILAGFVGFEVIRRVSPLLHTPLMSLTNALDAIVVVAAIIIAGRHETRLTTVLGAIAVAASFSNMVGGFLITDRMLRMFKIRQVETIMTALALQQYLDFAYIVGSRSLHSFSQVAEFAGAVRAGAFWRERSARRWPLSPRSSTPNWCNTSGSFITLIIGAGVGVPLGLVQMTAVPQRTALSHAFGALSAAMIGIAEYYVGTAAGHALSNGRDRAGSHHRVAHVYRQPDRRGKAAGIAAAAAHRLSRAEYRQPFGSGGGARAGGCAGGESRACACCFRSW